MNVTDPLIRDGDAANMLGSSKATFWRRVADGTIPRPLAHQHFYLAQFGDDFLRFVTLDCHVRSSFS
jgi:hypothetical protein